MEKQEELLNYFARKANEILFKYSIASPTTDYGYQYLRMSSYFGKFNDNLIKLENELNLETQKILSNYLNEDIDISSVMNCLTTYRQNTKLQYIISNNP